MSFLKKYFYDSYVFEKDIMGNVILFFFFSASGYDFYTYEVCEAIPYSQIQTMQIVICVSGMKLSVIEHL